MVTLLEMSIYWCKFARFRGSISGWLLYKTVSLPITHRLKRSYKLLEHRWGCEDFVRIAHTGNA